MRNHQLLASTVQAGDRVLYVGPHPAKFFAATRHAEPNSRTAVSLLDEGLTGHTFDLIVLSAVIDTLSDDTALRWGERALTLLGPEGRLVVDVRPNWVDMSWPGFDFESLREFAEPSRLLDPASIVRCFQGTGFRHQRHVSHWLCTHHAEVLTVGPTAHGAALPLQDALAAS